MTICPARLNPMSGARRVDRPPVPAGWLELLPQYMGMPERGELMEAIEHGEQARAVRLNKIEADELASCFPAEYKAVPWSERSYFLSGDMGMGKHSLHDAGAYYLQEPSAMAAAAALDVQPGQRVLDLCAAPGGKSGQITARLGGRGLLVTNEPFADRMRVLRGNLVRLGVANSLMLSETPDRLAERFAAAFDRVLVDAPCSGEGMFRREAAARLAWSEASVRGCARRQRAILRAARVMVRPGGILVYSTCTFNRVENEETVRAFLEENGDFAAEDFTLPGLPPSQYGMLRLAPHRIKGEGQFVARLRRVGGDEGAEPTNCGYPGQRPGKRELEAFERFRRDVLTDWHPEGALMNYGGWLCVLGESFGGLPDVAGLNVKGIGLELGTFDANVFVPAKALAMAVDAELCARSIHVDDDQARAWLGGGAVKVSGCGLTGWVIVVYKGLSLGIGMVDMNRLKKHSFATHSVRVKGGKGGFL